MTAPRHGTAERTSLYDLLPAVHRRHDEEGDGVLRALLAIVDGQIDGIEADIAQLYDDAFIETCAEWVVPYIGDLLGVRNLQEIRSANFSRRAYVANTIAYRRRKGTLTVLEQLAVDVTGWTARAVEFFELLSTTQYLNHLRPHNRTTLDLRSPIPELAGTAFESTTHTGEVRRIASDRGRYNILNIGLYLWRLQAYPVADAQARRFAAGDFRFFFEPVDLSAIDQAPPLFNSPEAETDIADRADEIHVAAILRRRALHDELDALRQGAIDEAPELEQQRGTRWFDDDPVLEVRFAGEADPVPPDQIAICDLSDGPGGAWRRPPASIEYTSSARGLGTITSSGTTVIGVGTTFDTDFQPGDSIVAAHQVVEVAAVGGPTTIETAVPFAPALPTGTRYRLRRPMPIRVGVDPRLGRIALADGEAADELRVGYAYGFSGDVGAGVYDRTESVRSWVDPPATIEDRVTWHAGVAVDPDPPAVGSDQIFPTFSAAVAAWNAIAAANDQAVGLITVMDNSIYAEGLTGADALVVGPAQMLVVAAGQWPTTYDADGNQQPRRPGRIEPVDLRPTVVGDIEIEGAAPSGADDGGRVIFDGVLIEGSVTVRPGGLRRLSIHHCTVVPARGGVRVDAVDADGQRNDDLTLELIRSISGPIAVDPGVESVVVEESIVDAGGAGSAVAAPGGDAGPACTFVRSTILGSVDVRRIDLGSESIFDGRVVARRTQVGCMRFSYVPRDPDPNLDSRTPRRYRCQPDLALVERSRELDLAHVGDLPSEVATAIRSRVRPLFTDVDFGRPGYVQLTPVTAHEIGRGAENETEMGVWWHLMNPHRLENLATALDEYLRFGLEAGPRFVT